MISFNKNKINHLILNRLKNKALQERSCHFKIAAIAFSKRGNFIGISMNNHRSFFSHSKGSGLHAEMILMKKYGKTIDKIFLIRFGKDGDVLPIDPCENCAKAAKKLNIKIISLSEYINE
jgi:cytidine deaminase